MLRAAEAEETTTAVDLAMEAGVVAEKTRAVEKGWAGAKPCRSCSCT
jgi:hypothetical protein